MAAVELPRPLQEHVPMTLEDGRDHNVKDLTEDDLGIYEDNADCADLTDSELEDYDPRQATSSKLGRKSSRIEGITVITEEEEPTSSAEARERSFVSEAEDTHRPVVENGNGHLDETFHLSDTEHCSKVLSGESEDRKPTLPLAVENDTYDTKGPNTIERQDVRKVHNLAPPMEIYPVGEKTHVSSSNGDIQFQERTESVSSAGYANREAFRGKANTPVSHITELTGIPDCRSVITRKAPGATDRLSRDAMYKKAIGLVYGGNLNKVIADSPWTNPFGIPDPQYFYVQQNKPSPMPPLKAWRGYHGNVYFEPIKVSPVNGSLPEGKPDFVERQNTRSRLSYSEMAKENRPGYRSKAQATPDRSASLPTNYPFKVSSSFNKPGPRQMSVLDKRSVINRFNTSIDEDLVWIEGQENTGTLAINSKRHTSDTKTEPSKPIREGLCRGLVSHKQTYLKRKKLPQFSVTGDKYVPPPIMSPLLRTLTQYSLSNARVTNTSPEHAYEKLPPLEQLKTTLRSINNSHEDPYRKPGSVSRHPAVKEEYKPFVKYSPEIRAKYEKHRAKMT